MHPLLLDQLEKLTAAAEAERAKDLTGGPGPNAKLLGHLLDLMFVKIPQNPGDPIYRQGKTLGPELKNWFRGKTGNGRYRLFFRYDSSAKVIVYAWVNDEQSLRTYGSATDAYTVFRRMVLEDKNPPKDWDELMAAAKAKGAVQRARALADINAGRRA
jgi:toxin YhaV